MSTYKAAIQGTDHKRIPKDIDVNPTIVGHEFCGEIVEVGTKWKDQFQPGDKFSIQPALNLGHDNYSAPGYSYPYIGGNATYIIIPNVVMEQGCLLKYASDTFYFGSLAEPMSCIVSAYHYMYHTKRGSYELLMGIVNGGNMAILAGVGPMGLGAIDYAVHSDRRPGILVVTDIDDARLERAASIYTVEEAAKNGVALKYVNTAKVEKLVEYLRSLTGGKGFDDVIVFAPVKPVVEQGHRLLADDGCLVSLQVPAILPLQPKLIFTMFIGIINNYPPKAVPESINIPALLKNCLWAYRPTSSFSIGAVPIVVKKHYSCDATFVPANVNRTMQEIFL